MAANGQAKRGHPAGLYFLFFTEMWERFSYYGMRALLVYYMTKQLLFTQEKSSQIYGLYTGFVYFTPFFGGLLADRVLGQRKTVFIGGILMAIGQFLLMLEQTFYLGLIFLIVGNGCFKPNISTQVGSLYEPEDMRRDRAFSIFYVGINIGACFAPLICGTLGEVYGWKWGFFAAGCGMITGLIIYSFAQKYLAPDNVMKKAAGVVDQSQRDLTSEEKNRIWALVALCAFNIIFWATYEQQGNTFALWMDANTDRTIFGWEMPATWLQSFNPAMIFLFTPAVIWLWTKQAEKGKEPTSTTKMAMGCILLGLSFLLMVGAAMQAGETGKASLLWLVGATFVLTIGELYLSPVGLSLVTKLSPVHMVSSIMGIWFLSSFAGNYLCGFLGTYWEKMPKEHFFLLLSGLACSAGIGIFAIQKPLKKAIGMKNF